MSFELRVVPLDTVRALCQHFHGYASAGGVSVYSWGVVEAGRLVAAFAWQPPPPGAAKAVCPEAPQGVLALSRMVAAPKHERSLNHISKPLRKQMKLIDRGRWPVLLTYSDEGQGHGHVYKCSGWEKTQRAERQVWLEDGKRASRYSNGNYGSRELDAGGLTWIQRWEQWACPRGQAAQWMLEHGWERVAVPGKKWRSGNQAFRWEQR